MKYHTAAMILALLPKPDYVLQRKQMEHHLAPPPINLTHEEIIEDGKVLEVDYDPKKGLEMHENKFSGLYLGCMLLGSIYIWTAFFCWMFHSWEPLRWVTAFLGLGYIAIDVWWIYRGPRK